MKLADDLLKGANAAADYLGLKPRTIYNMVEANQIPHVRKGSLIFFRKSELDAAFVSAPLAPGPKRATAPTPISKGEVALTTAQVLPYFVEAFADGENGYTWMLARLHNLKKLCKLDVERRGRGNPFSFTRDHVWKMSLLLLLGKLGIGPKKAIAHMDAHGDDAPLPGVAGEWIIEGNLSKLVVSTGHVAKLANEMLPQLFPADPKWTAMESFMRDRGADANVIAMTREDYTRYGAKA